MKIKFSHVYYIATAHPRMLLCIVYTGIYPQEPRVSLSATFAAPFFTEVEKTSKKNKKRKERIDKPEMAPTIFSFSPSLSLRLTKKKNYFFSLFLQLP